MNLLASYFVRGFTRVFPDIEFSLEGLLGCESTNQTTQFLLEDPLQELSNSRRLVWDDEVDRAFLNSRSDLLSRFHEVLDMRPHVSTETRSASITSTSLRCSIELGDDSVFIQCRPLGTEIEILAGYLVALSSVGVLESLRVGDIDLDEAEELIFRPRIASLFGQLPFGSDLVSGVNELLSELFCSPPGPIDPSYLESQTKMFLSAIEMYVDNVQSNFAIDPRWALTARVARAVLRLQSSCF